MELTRRALLSLPKSRPTPATQATNVGFWLHLAREAMACKFEVTLPSELEQHLDAAHAALDSIDRLEAQLSIFRESSELSHINRLAQVEPVPAEPQLLALLERCAALSGATGGAFDITSTPLSKVWGFLRREGRVPTEAELAEARAHVGMEHVELDGPAGTVRFRRPGLALNLGSVGKGYALDRVAAELMQAGVPTALLTGGSSSVLALGRGPEGTGFLVGLRDPHDHSRRFGTVRLAKSALGVSGAGEQHFAHDGRVYGHIIDPRTGWPVEGRVFVAVVAPTAELADALATAFFVGGRTLAERYVKQYPEVSVLMIDSPPANQNVDENPPTIIGRRSPWSVPRAL
jgi:thiamine biosynthesis lipoprotein